MLICDQTGATDRRRRRKRGTMEDSKKRIFINSLVGEGCGNCGDKSCCVSVLPLVTEYGRTRGIDESNCNKDFSRVNDFCPSFASVVGGGLKKIRARAKVDFSALPQPHVAMISSVRWREPVVQAALGGGRPELDDTTEGVGRAAT